MLFAAIRFKFYSATLHSQLSNHGVSLQSTSALAAFAQAVDSLIQVNLSPNTTSWSALNQFSGTPQSVLDAILRIVIPQISPKVNTTDGATQLPSGSRRLLSSAPPPTAAAAPVFVNWTAAGRTTPVRAGCFLSFVLSVTVILYSLKNIQTYIGFK